MLIIKTGHWWRINGDHMFPLAITETSIDCLHYMGEEILKPKSVLLKDLEKMTVSKKPRMFSNSLLPRPAFIPFGQLYWDEDNSRVRRVRYTQNERVISVDM